MFASVWLVALGLAGCAEPQVKPSEQHIKVTPRPAGAPPALLTTPTLAEPRPIEKPETYSVVVNNVAARDVLFALARDAKMDIDIAGDIDGQITLNALSQTLPQLLDRIARQVDMRWEKTGKVLSISRDTPYLKNYKIDYVNLSRQTTNSVNVATQIAGSSGGSSGGGGGGGGSSGGSGSGNSSQSNVTSKSTHEFWDTLLLNVRDLLRETDRILPGGDAQTSQSGAGAATSASPSATTAAPAAVASAISGASSSATTAASGGQQTTFREAASVIANREAGVIAVRATARQHEKVGEFLSQVINSARRQVLIEATIVEVQLNDQSQTGVDWKSVALASGFSFRQNLMGAILDKAVPDPTRVALISSIMGDSNLSPVQKSNLVEQIAKGMGQASNYTTTEAGVPTVNTLAGLSGATVPLADSRFTGGRFPITGGTPGMTIGYGKGSNFVSAIQMLSQFGRTKVISSPKITALNNQSAVLRVVDNLVYFTVSSQTTASTTATNTTYTSTANTVAVGFVMTVVPQIDDGHQVTLTVRPSISRLKGYVQDPNPALQTVPNMVPVVQTREMESVMKIPSGNVIMMGGLMEDSEGRGNDGVPGLSDVPGLGQIFSTRNNQAIKTELVVFLRPIVVTDPSLEGDYRFAKELLPGKDFFNQPVERPLPKLKGTSDIPGGGAEFPGGPG